MEYKVNTQKSIIFLYTINKQVEFKIKRIIPFIALTSKKKYLCINITKHIQNLYEENYRTVIKKNKTTNKCIYIPTKFMDRKLNIFRMTVSFLN